MPLKKIKQRKGAPLLPTLSLCFGTTVVICLEENSRIGDELQGVGGIIQRETHTCECECEVF